MKTKWKLPADERIISRIQWCREPNQDDRGESCTYRDLTAWTDLISRRELSSRELAQHYIDRIKRLDGQVQSYITLCEEQALQEAEAADGRLAKGESRGALHGIPLAVKDIFWTKGVRTTSGSSIQADFVPDADAAAWEKLSGAGALLLGKLNMHEFAYGTTTENPHYGICRNPWDTGRTAGGSSGGSAAALAIDLTPASLGTDTGGSIRIPAACCGVVGLKPTFGRVSKHGVFPLARTLDHVGPMARTVRDAALLMNILAGYDERDPHSVRRPREDFAAQLGASVRGMKVGVERSFFHAHADRELVDAVERAADVLRSAGMSVVEVDMPILADIPVAQNITISVEALSVHDAWLSDPDRRYGMDVRTRLENGRPFTAIEYAEAQWVRARFARHLEQQHGSVDVLLTPVTPFFPPVTGAETVLVNGREMVVRRNFTRFTNPFNLTGSPAISVPFGLSREGLPLAVQLVGAAFSETKLLQIAAVVEQANAAAVPPHFTD